MAFLSHLTRNIKSDTKADVRCEGGFFCFGDIATEH